MQRAAVASLAKARSCRADHAKSRAQKQNGRTFVQPLRRNTLRHLANSEGDDISFEMASEKKNYFFFLPFFFFFIAMVISFG
jgi:hypothetical protein